MIKSPPANAGDIRDVDSIPGLGRSLGEENGKPLQYSFLENPVDRGAWWATVHRVSKSWTLLKWLSMHMHRPAPFSNGARAFVVIICSKFKMKCLRRILHIFFIGVRYAYTLKSEILYKALESPAVHKHPQALFSEDNFFF